MAGSTGLAPSLAMCIQAHNGMTPAVAMKWLDVNCFCYAVVYLTN